MGRSSRRKRDRRTVEIPLTDPQAEEFLRIVRDDLVFLKGVSIARPSRTEVRFASLVLRRLFHEGMYSIAWSGAGFEGHPSFNAVDLLAMVKDVPSEYIHYAYAGGADTEGARHAGYCLLGVPKTKVTSEGPAKTTEEMNSRLRRGTIRPFHLPEFCASPAVLAGAASISRLELIRYVANKIGGVHWDPRRTDWTDPLGSRYRFLDEGHLIVGRLPAPLYEIVSMVQCVSESIDTNKLIEHIDKAAPEEEGSLSVIKFREGRSGRYNNMTFNTRVNDDDQTKGT